MTVSEKAIVTSLRITGDREGEMAIECGHCHQQYSSHFGFTDPIPAGAETIDQPIMVSSNFDFCEYCEEPTGLR